MDCETDAPLPISERCFREDPDFGSRRHRARVAGLYRGLVDSRAGVAWDHRGEEWVMRVSTDERIEIPAFISGYRIQRGTVRPSSPKDRPNLASRLLRRNR
jgi:hypothetical protein